MTLLTHVDYNIHKRRNGCIMVSPAMIFHILWLIGPYTGVIIINNCCFDIVIVMKK